MRAQIRSDHLKLRVRSINGNSQSMINCGDLRLTPE